MEQNQRQFNPKSEYELKRENKLAEQEQAQRKQTIKRISKIVAIIAVVGGAVGILVWFVASRPQTPAAEIIARGGMHWHAELSIYINGAKQEIPANIGIGRAHQPIHTHDATGIIHLEFEGLVLKDDIKLGRFFKIWDKRFNSDCIFDFCGGPNGKVRMLINDRENNDFDGYLMQDGDKIEIRYE